MIPPTLHFIWINRGKLFGRGQYEALRSAVRNTTYNVVLHTNLLADTETEADCNPYTLVGLGERLRIDHMEFRTDLPVSAASLSDLYRLTILHKEGGIYSDLDIIWFKDIPIDMTGIRMFGAWENQSYKCAVNGLFGCEAGFDGIPELVASLEKSVNRRKICHWVFFKPSTAFIKKHADVMLDQKMFFRNGWRRIGRNLLDHQVDIPEEVRVQLTRGATQRMRFDNIVGFHWNAYFFKWADIAKLLPPGILG